MIRLLLQQTLSIVDPSNHKAEEGSLFLLDADGVVIESLLRAGK
jgi:hypothetical protein